MHPHRHTQGQCDYASYIEEIKPLTSYLKDSKKEIVSSVELFDFITDMNVSEFIGVFNEKDY